MTVLALILAALSLPFVWKLWKGTRQAIERDDEQEARLALYGPQKTWRRK